MSIYVSMLLFINQKCCQKSLKSAVFLNVFTVGAVVQQNFVGERQLEVYVALWFHSLAMDIVRSTGKWSLSGLLQETRLVS
jgi:hypothetical protein